MRPVHRVKIMFSVALALFVSGCISTEQTGTAVPSQENFLQLGTAPYALPPVPQMMPDTSDDLALGKYHFRRGSFGLAEKHFRLFVEANGDNPEGWLGLAASYDKLKRYDLADRAYSRAILLAGPRPEILNNRGYSALLRGNYKHARRDLEAARLQDPENPLILHNLHLLAQASARKR